MDMVLSSFLPSLVSWNKAKETDIDASQLRDDFGIDVLYDGTKSKTGQLLVVGEEDNQPCQEPVDIIAVHGLNGHPITTWTHGESGMMWLKDLLPAALPNSRIMSYGYDAKICGSRSTLRIADQASDLLSRIRRERKTQKLQSRRIIFIGHSMGGIVIKKALSMAREGERFSGLQQSTNGIMFMGTPHHGADGAKLASTAINIANSLIDLKKYQVKMLERGSEQLQEISRTFGHFQDLKIVNVIESDETKIPCLGKHYLNSARLNLGDRENFLIVAGADHHMVCKFRSEDDRNYPMIKDAIIELAVSPIVSKSSDVNEHHERLHSIDESINQGSGKIQEMLNEGFCSTQSSLTALSDDKTKKSLLKILDPLINNARKPKSGTAETGLAFLETEKYRDWKTGSASFLWVHGKSGTGKTVLVSTITKDISAYCASGITNSAAATVYCSWSDQDVASLISTLLIEFIYQMSEIPQKSADLIKKCPRGLDVEADLSEALHCILTHLGSAYIMIDGLDEWSFEKSRRRSLLEWIARLDGWNLPHLHVLVTSQNLPDIKETLLDKGAVRIDSRPDILIHVRHELRKDQQLLEFDQSLKTEIEEFLVVGSDEVFRWVSLQLEDLKSCSTQNEAREKIRTLPKTLKETYDKILDLVPQRSYVRAALQWIACSVRPLSLEALAIAADHDPTVPKPNGSENRLIGGGRAIHKMLSKLIDVHEVERSSFWDILRKEQGSRSLLDIAGDWRRAYEFREYPSHIVVFAHSSVRDYLLQRHDDADISWSISFSEDMAHRFIAKSCLAIIQNLSEASSVSDTAYQEGWHDLHMYVARHWHTHAVRLPDEEPGSLAHLLNEGRFARLLLCAEDNLTNDSFKDIVGLGESQTEPPSTTLKLQYAAYSGFSCVLDNLLASNPDLDVDASTEYGKTALSFACERQHWHIAHTLLQRGADPNKHDGDDVPLIDASTYGADDIVRELISHGADVNVECEPTLENTPLTGAIIADHQNIVGLLLINGADPNSVYPSPILVAAEYGKHECMALLLEHGASLEVEDIYSASPLELAAASGSVETVKLLLAQGLNVNEQMPLPAGEMLPGIRYKFRYPRITDAELRQNCIISYDRYGSPMHAAAAHGRTEVIKLLVENNAAVNEKSQIWETPSTLAKLRGHEEALKYLMSRGGVASEQTKVCYRQDLFYGSGDLNQGPRFREVYDDNEDDNMEDEDMLSNDDGFDTCCEEW